MFFTRSATLHLLQWQHKRLIFSLVLFPDCPHREQLLMLHCSITFREQTEWGRQCHLGCLWEQKNTCSVLLGEHVIIVAIFCVWAARDQHINRVLSREYCMCTRGMIHNKVHLISQSCPRHIIALHVQNRCLKHHSFHFLVNRTFLASEKEEI